MLTQQRAADDFSTPGHSWRRRADELARWAGARLVSRTDVWGYYSADGQRFTGPPVKQRGKVSLAQDRLRSHFAAHDRQGVLGTHTTDLEDLCLWGGLDIDAHGGDGAKLAAANEAAALHWYGRLAGWGFRPLLTTEGGGGFHERLLFSRKVGAGLLQALLRFLVSDFAGVGLPGEPECFPKQPSLGRTAKKCGNWMRLPGRHHGRDAWSQVWGGARWLSGDAAIDFILALPGDPPELLDRVPIPKPPGATGTTGRAVYGPRPVGDGKAAYGRKALDEEFGLVANAQPTRRNIQLNSSAFSLGQLVGGGVLARGEVEEALARAANAAGLDADRNCGPGGIAATIRSGLEAGMAQPRGVPERSGGGNPNAPAGSTPPPPDEGEPHLTDVGNARRFVADHGAALRWCEPWGSWLLWDGCRWQRNQTRTHERLARQTIAGMFRSAQGEVGRIAKLLEDSACGEH